MNTDCQVPIRYQEKPQQIFVSISRASRRKIETTLKFCSGLAKLSNCPSSEALANSQTNEQLLVSGLPEAL